MAGGPYRMIVGAPRGRQGTSTATHVVMEVNTYDQLEQHLASFLTSREHNLLRTSVTGDVDGWGIGVPSAVKRAVQATDRVHSTAFLGKVMWVKLPYDRGGGWSLRTVQRRVAEGVVGVDVANELMDGMDEEDDYSGIRVENRGVVEEASRRISEELWRLGRYLLVIENWWEAYSPVLDTLGIPLPSRWSPQGSKLILWDPLFEGDMNPLGEPTGNAWLLLKVPAADNRLTYIYREAVDLVDVLTNSGGHGRVDDAAMITPQVVLNCLLHTSCLLLTEWTNEHPLRQCKSELVQFWVQARLINDNMSTTNHNIASHKGLLAATSEDDNIIHTTTTIPTTTTTTTTTAEALLEELLHRRVLVLLKDDNVEAVDMMIRPLEWLWDLANSVAPQGYQGFQPHKFVIFRRPIDDGSNFRDSPENVEGLSLVDVQRSKASLLDDALIVDDSKGSPVSKYVNMCNLRTLVADHIPSFIADGSFLKMNNLRVLIIFSAKVSSLPSSLFGLPNLRILQLRDCEFFDASLIHYPPTRTPLDLHELRVLDLRGSSILHFPNQVLAGILQVLDISSNGLIESVPEPLVAAAPHLKRLILSNCSQLKTLTPRLYSHPTLEELDLRSCIALQEKEIEFKAPRLKLIFLSGSPAIQRLSFRGCSRLEVAELHKLINLESLDLSGTSIKELNLQDTFPTTSLVLLGAKDMRTFPWKMMQRLPEELILDQHMVEASNRNNKDADLTHRPHSYGGGRGLWMRVHDGRFFRTLCDPEKGTYSKLKKGGSPLFQAFYINICPSVKQGKKKGNIHGLAPRVPSQYKGIQVHPKILKKQPPLSRHVEIQASHAPPRDIYGFLEDTLSLTVSDQHAYRSLSELIPEGSVVMQCLIEKCHGMEAIFECSAGSCLLRALDILWASELGNVVALAAVKKGTSFNWSQGFTNLKHIHLEFCPKLKYIFPPGARQSLQSLEILEILFCPNLEEVFASSSQESQQAMLSSSSSTLPFARCLRIVHLLHLPSLVSICHEADKHWPALQRFMVRGCWRLQKLPFLAYAAATTTADSSSPVAGIVTINGEPVWWNRVLQANAISEKHVFHFTGIDVPLPMPKK